MEKFSKQEMIFFTKYMIPKFAQCTPTANEIQEFSQSQGITANASRLTYSRLKKKISRMMAGQDPSPSSPSKKKPSSPTKGTSKKPREPQTPTKKRHMPRMSEWEMDLFLKSDDEEDEKVDITPRVIMIDDE